jgi:zinc resistance-associated protein
MNRHVKKAGYLILVAILAVVCAAPLAWAGPRGMGMGPGGANLTPEQSQQLFDLRQQFLKETEDLRQQLMVKRTELNNLWAAANPDEKAIRAKQQEINALRDKIQGIAVSYQAKARKIAPNASFGWGKGGGRGPWGSW